MFKDNSVLIIPSNIKNDVIENIRKEIIYLTLVLLPGKILLKKLPLTILTKQYII